MKKWISLLLAGVLVSAFMVGCGQQEEGSTDTPTTTGSADGKMEEKKSDEGTAPETKMEGEAKADETK